MEFTCAARQSGQQLIVTAAGDVALDCSGVTFMDSMGLRVMVELRQALSDAGRTLTLTKVSTPVSRVLELAGVESFFGLPAGASSAEEPA